MPSIVLPSPGTSASISLVLDLSSSQNIAANQSTVNYNAYLYRNNTSGTGAFDSSASSTRYLSIGAAVLINSVMNWDFRASSGLGGVGATNAIGSGSYPFNHNADGTLSLGYNLTFVDGGTKTIGDGTVSGTLVLPTIPRASTPSFTVSGSPVTTVDAGTTVTITTNRASSGFTHTLEYNFNGAGWVTIATGVGASTTWAPPTSLLNSIPNATSAVASIRTTTYSGATLIGSPTTKPLTITVPTSAVPSFSAITHAEAVSAVSTVMGGTTNYVQNLSKLALAITGAAGVYSSTIAAYKLEVNGQTINAVSGTTPAVISASGTVVVTGTVTDSRGRTYSNTQNVTVAAYAPPEVVAVQVRRSDNAGVVDEEGTYIRVDINASAQSLLVSAVQKNRLYYKIYTRERGDSTWDLKDTVDTGAITFNSYDVATGTYAVEQSWEVLVEVYDKFNLVQSLGTVATAQVFMHWGGADEGLGVGKFWEQGNLDVLGQIYQNDAKRVLDEDDLADVDSAIDDVEDLVAVHELEITTLETLTANAPDFSARIPLPLSQTIRPNFGYTWGNPLDPYVPFWLTRSSAGVVTIEGVGSGITVASGVVLAVLPAGYRPSREMNFQCAFNSGRSLVTVKANGEISLNGSINTTDYFALSNVKFVAAADEANFTVAWTNLTMQNSWIADGTHIPQYAVDQYGCVWLRGKVSKAGTWTDSQVIASLPSTYNKMQAIYNAFCPTYSTMRYGAAGGGVGSNIMAGSAVAGVSMTLDGVLIVPDAIYAGNYTRAGANNSHPMGAIPFQGTWANYNAASFTSLGIWKRPDGLVIPSGLIMSGSLGTAAMQVPAGARPFQTQVFENSATMSIGQTTVYGPHGSLGAGSFVPVVGAASYISPEGIAWNAGN